MKKILFLLIILFGGLSLQAAVIPPHTAAAAKDPMAYFATLKIKEVEKLAGRKLSFKEKIAVKVFQWKIRKGWQYVPEKKKDLGKSSLILGIAGIVLLVTPVIGGLAALVCSILAITTGYKARKANPDDRKAKTGVILGWIGIGLFIAVLILVIAVLASFTGGWG